MTSGTRAAGFGMRSKGVDERQVREVMGSFATGVAVVTTLGEDGGPVGVTVNSFTSLSLDPPLVLWSLSLEAPSLSAFRSHESFAVNILAEDQDHLCVQFATPAQDKFAGVPFRPGLAGVPLIEGVVAQIECRVFARHPGGDHEIFLGEIFSLRAEDRAPLIVHRGAFRRLVSAGAGSGPGGQR